MSQLQYIVIEIGYQQFVAPVEVLAFLPRLRPVRSEYDYATKDTVTYFSDDAVTARVVNADAIRKRKPDPKPAAPVAVPTAKVSWTDSLAPLPADPQPATGATPDLRDFVHEYRDGESA